MINKHWCKTCFKTVVDDTATDNYLLMSGPETICSSCGKQGPVVVTFFKYGEHRVTPEGRILSSARRLKVNPEYSYWGSEPPYVELTNS